MSNDDENILIEIEKNHGRLTAEIVVEEAKAKGHPFHDRIWGESKEEAAHQRRLDLARKIIRSVRFVIAKGPPIIRSPSFVRDPEIKPSEPGYRQVRRIGEERDSALRSLQLEADRIRGSLSRGDSLASAYSLEREFELMLGDIGILRQWPHMEAAE